MLASMHFNKLRDYYLLSSHRATKSQSVDTAKEFILQFEIDPVYIGLAIGKGGANIQKARKLPGIISVEIKNESIVILGILSIRLFHFNLLIK